jgi:hypothetical protein
MSETTDEKTKLQCPFCGGVDIRFTKHPLPESPTGEEWSTCCYRCMATFPNRFRKELLVEQWQRRPVGQKLENEALREDREKLQADVRELNDRLIERTQDYLAGAARDRREFNAVKVGLETKLRLAIEVLEKQHCTRCQNKGVFYPRCWKCETSGEDHDDCPPAEPCMLGPCVERRQALESLREAPRPLPSPEGSTPTDRTDAADQRTGEPRLRDGQSQSALLSAPAV